MHGQQNIKNEYEHVPLIGAFKTWVWNMFGVALYSCHYRRGKSCVAATSCTGEDEEN